MVYVLLYLLVVLDAVRSTFGDIQIMLFISLLVTGIITSVALIMAMNPDDTLEDATVAKAKNVSKRASKWAIGFLTAWVVVTGMKAFTPTTKQAAFIIGGGQVYSVLTGEKAAEIGNDAYTIVQGLMKEYADQCRAENIKDKAKETAKEATKVVADKAAETVKEAVK